MINRLMEAMCADWLHQYDAYQEQIASEYANDPRPIIEIDTLTNWLRNRFISRDPKTERDPKTKRRDVFLPMSVYQK